MMQKLLYLIAGVALLTSCSKDGSSGVDSGQMINFNTAEVENTGSVPNTQQTKGADGTIINASSLNVVGNQFNVYSVYALQGVESQVFDTQPQTVTYTAGAGTGGTNAWSYSPKKMWINTAKYRFRAYYPSAADVVTSSSDVNLLTIGYNIAANNYDLLVAYLERTPASGGTASLKLPFKHALSALRFEIMYDPTTIAAGTTDQITQAYMQDLCVVGLMTFGGTGADVEKIKWSQSYYDSEKRYEWTGSRTFGVGAANKGVIYDGSGLVFAIPQTASATTPTTFHFWTTKGGDRPHIASIPPITWMPGKIYTYTITLSAASVDVTVSIKDWANYKSNVDIYI